MDRTLAKLLDYEAEQCRAQLAELQADLAAFEAQYGMASAEFFHRYQTGQTDDRMDFIEWASLVHMQSGLLRRLELLTGQTPP